ncbi:MAG: hypothetical protein A2V77_00400 [Anaeromyxobacter sp. RBG_16_69_14]|nr:MAG: hypothetical protein A2V77_00400 [Anaeromyxobacter sp. RBG_16_69_14]
MRSERILVPAVLFALASFAPDPFAAGATASAAVSSPTGGDGSAVGDGIITVMTQNLYLGADIEPLIGAIIGGATQEQIELLVGQGWALVQKNDFPRRAEEIADLVEQVRPELIGLQEMALWRVETPGDGAPGAPPDAIEVDYLSILLAALAARHLDYVPASVIQNFDGEFPGRTGTGERFDLRYTDRDAILARSDVTFTNPQGGNFAAMVGPDVGVPIAIPRGWTSVEVELQGERLRVFEAHLETSSPIQELQALELVIRAEAGVTPVALLGDFNSDANGTGTDTYAALLAPAFRDAWSVAHPGEPGLTCCHLADLTLAGPPFTTRIDLVLTGKGVTPVHAEILPSLESADFAVGDVWPSDHAGVGATLRLAKPRFVHLSAE